MNGEKRVRLRRRRRRRSPTAALSLCALLLLSCALLFSSCAQGDAHLTIRPNGTADLDIGASVDKRTLELVGRPDLPQRLADVLRERGMDATAEEDGERSGLRATRRLNLKDMADQPPDLPEGIEAEQTTEERFFLTRHRIAVTLDMNRLLQAYGGDVSERIAALPQIAKKLVESQLDFDFLLTLPIKPGANNADEARDGGRTLVWHLDPFGTNRLEASIAVPNVRHIALTAGPAALLLAAAVANAVWRWRHRRRRKAG